jgi:hypothetical protein
MRCSLLLVMVFTYSATFAQTDLYVEIPMDVTPLTDDQAAALAVDAVVARPIEVKTPAVRMPVVDLPDASASDVRGFSVAAFDTSCLKSWREGVQAIDVATVSVAAPQCQGAAKRIKGSRISSGSAIARADSRIPAIQDFRRQCRAVFSDKRMVKHDRGLKFDNHAAQKWLDIYGRPLPPPIASIPMPTGVRMIAELRLLEDGGIPTATEYNLGIYARLGYNACLITVYGHETPAKLLALAGLVRSAGMSPWFAWSGPESLSATIFHDPARLARLLSPLAQVSEGYLCAWRRTSAHLVEQDPQYLEHIVAIIRKANPAIPVIGESYYGQTWRNLPHVNQAGWQARDNVPRNPSGILIAGIATRGYNIDNMLATTFARWRHMPRLGLVLGERPYYASTANTGRTWRENLQIKIELERRWIRAGCQGTITIHGDGSELGTTPQATDNLGVERITEK